MEFRRYLNGKLVLTVEIAREQGLKWLDAMENLWRADIRERIGEEQNDRTEV